MCIRDSSYTHLCVSDNSRYLFAANYHVGSTASYLLENNFIKEKICAIHHTGLGPDLLKRQTGPHCHYVGITPDKEFVYAVDLGADKVIMYTYQDGKLEEDVEHTLNVVPGSGPPVSYTHLDVYKRQDFFCRFLCSIINF